MKVQHGEEVANHSDPESCGAHREVCVEALTGETGRPAIEPRNDQFGMPTLLSEAEGNTVHGVNRKPCPDPARSETLCMSGSLSYGSSEISSVSSANGLDGAGKVVDHNPVVNADEKSDTPIVPQKLPNKGDDPAEAMEGRGVIGGNAFETPACRTQSRIKHASMGIEGVREAAKRDPKMRFTALMHHITPTLLVKSFHALRKQAASGVDGVTWYDYEHMLTKGKDYFWAPPGLVAHKTRSMELQAGQPQTKGNRRGPAYAYNVKKLRDQEMRVAAQAEKHYERFIDAWRPRRPKEKARGRLNPARLE